MKISRLHEDICVYVDEVMEADRKMFFEQLILKNSLLKCFVDDAVKGKSILKNYSKTPKLPVRN